MRRRVARALATTLAAALAGTVAAALPAAPAAAAPADQTVTFGTPPPEPVVGGGWRPMATSDAPRTPSLSVVAVPSAACSLNVARTRVSFDARGTCTVTARVIGDAGYKEAFVSVELTIRTAQTLAFETPASPARVVSADPWSPPITRQSTGTPITYAVVATPAAACSAADDGLSVTLSAVGSCAVTAAVPGDDTYAPGTVSRTFSVRTPRTLAITAPTGTYLARGTWTPVVTGAGTSPVTLASTTTGVCTIATNGRDVSLLTAGECAITASVPDGDTEAAATATGGVTVGLADPGLVVTQPTAHGLALETWTPVVTRSGSAAITLESGTPDVCEPLGAGKISLKTKGECRITARIEAGTVYDADEDTATLTVDPRPVTISWEAEPTGPRYRDRVTVTATAVDAATGDPVEGSGHVVIAGVDAEDPAPTDVPWPGGSLSREFDADDVRTFQASAHFVPADTDVHAEEDDTHPVVVGKATLTASFSTPTAAELVVGETWTDAAVLTPADSGLTPELTSLTTAACTVSGNDVTFKTTAECRLRARHTDGSARYEPAAAVTKSFYATLRPVVVTLTSSPAAPVYGDTVTVTATVTDAATGDPVTGGSGSMTISGNTRSGTWTDGVYTRTFTAATVTTHSVTATFGGVTGRYATGEATPASIVVGKAPQAITWSTSTIPSPAYVDGSWTPSATGGASGKAVTLTTEDRDVCQVVTTGGTRIVLTGDGTCRVLAHQDGDTRYQAADTETSFTVRLRPVALEVTVDDASPVFGGTVVATVVATDVLTGARVPGAGTGTIASGGLGPTADLTYATGRASHRYESVRVGDYTLTATFAATRAHAYASATDTVDVSVTRAPQAVTLRAVPDPAYVGTPWTPVLTRGASTGEVHVTVPEDAPCSVTDLTVTFTAIASCVVTVTQDGDGDYLDAPAQTRSVTPTSRPVRVAVTTTTPPEYGTSTTVLVKVTDGLQPAATAEKVPGVGTAELAGVAGTSTSFDPETMTASITYTPTSAGPQDVVVTLTPGTARWAPLVAHRETFSVALAKQTIAVSGPAAPAPGYVTDTWTPTLTGTGSADPVVLGVLRVSSEICSVDAHTVTFDREGTCRLEATKPAVEGQYEAATAVGLEVTVRRIPVTVSLRVTRENNQPGPLAVDAVLEVRAKAVAPGRGARGGDLLVAGSGTIGVDRVVNGTITPLGTSGGEAWYGSGRFLSTVPRRAGSYQVWHEFVPADSRVYAVTPYAAPPAGQAAPLRQVRTATETVGRAGQTIEVTAVPDPAYVDGSWFPAPTGGGSRNDVEVTASGGCERRGSDAAPEIYLTSPDPCTVAFHQDDDADYLAADRTETFDVDRAPTTVTLSVSEEPVVGSPVTVTARATASSVAGAAVRGSYVITVEGQDLTTTANPDGTASVTYVPTSRGTVATHATFTPADENAFAGSERPGEVAVGAGTQRFTSAAAPTEPQFVEDTWAPHAVVDHGPPGASVTVATAPGICSWDGALVHLDAEGTCTVTLTVAESPLGSARPDWLPAAQVVERIVTQRNPVEVVLTAASSPILVDGDLGATLVVTGTLSGTETVTDLAGTVTVTRNRVSTDPADPPGPVTIATVPVVGGRAGIPLGATPGGDRAFAQAGSYVLTATFTPQRSASFATALATASVVVQRHPQTLPDPDQPGSVHVLGSWTYAHATGSSGLPVALSIETPAGEQAHCTASGLTVTYVSKGPCQVVVRQAGDRYWNPVGHRPLAQVDRSPTTVAVGVPASTTVGSPVTLTADVAVPVLPAPDAPAPAGVVQFAVDGVALGSPVAVAGGRATTRWTPSATDSAADVTATFTPTGDSTRVYDPATSTAGRIAVAPAPVTVTVEVTTAVLRATVAPRVAAAGTPGGDVVFTLGDGTRVATAPLSASGVAVAPNTLDPTARVTVVARYGGDHDRAPGTGDVERLLPTITARPGSVDGWQNTAVRITYSCRAPGGATLETGCPRDFVFTDDARAQSHTETIRASNGGQATVRVGGVDVDRTGPVVRVTGVTRGADYRDTPPRGRCAATDALSGLVSCTTRTVVDGRDKRRFVATATDRAGNTTVVSVPYRQLKEWVVGAPLRGTRFAVRPGSTVRVAATTTSAKPQLMLARKGGGWTPGPVMVAESVREGVFLYSTTTRLPRSLTGYRLGVRLQGSPKIQVVRLVAR